MRQYVALFIVLSVARTALPAVRGKHAVYIAGSIASIEKGAQGHIDVSGDTEMVFRPERGESWRLPYLHITALEFGKKTGHRTGAGIGVGLTVGLIPGLVVWASHKEKHYLAIGFTGSNGKRAAVAFEVAKDVVWPIIAEIQLKTGLKATTEEYQRVKGAAVVGNELSPLAAASARPRISVTSSPIGALIEVDGAKAGTTPATFPIDVGNHAVVVRERGFVPWTATVQAESGKSVEIHAQLVRQTATPEPVAQPRSQPKQQAPDTGVLRLPG